MYIDNSSSTYSCTIIFYIIRNQIGYKILNNIGNICHLNQSSDIHFHFQVFPEALFVQLLKVMLHPDVEIRIGGHQIFCVLLIPSFAHTRNDVTNHPRRWHSKSMSTFSSIAALLEKLRLEINGTKIRHGGEQDDHQQLNKVEEEWKHGRSHKNSPNIHLISSIMDKTGGPASLTETVGISSLSSWIHFCCFYCYMNCLSLCRNNISCNATRTK